MLTDLGIRTLPPPAKGVKRYWDKDGLCLQVSQGGAKTFYFVHGDDRRFVKLGRYPRDLSLAQARENVKSIIAQAGAWHRGRHVAGYRSRCDRSLRVRRTATSRNKPRTAADTRYFLSYLAPMAKRRMTGVGTR